MIRTIERARDFHANQSQVKAQREYDEKLTGFKHTLSPDDHEQRRIALDDLLNEIDPVNYPDVNKFLELMK